MNSTRAFRYAPQELETFSDHYEESIAKSFSLNLIFMDFFFFWLVCTLDFDDEWMGLCLGSYIYDTHTVCKKFYLNIYMYTCVRRYVSMYFTAVYVIRHFGTHLLWCFMPWFFSLTLTMTGDLLGTFFHGRSCIWI